MSLLHNDICLAHIFDVFSGIRRCAQTFDCYRVFSRCSWYLREHHINNNPYLTFFGCNDRIVTVTTVAVLAKNIEAQKKSYENKVVLLDQQNKCEALCGRGQCIEKNGNKRFLLVHNVTCVLSLSRQQGAVSDRATPLSCCASLRVRMSSGARGSSPV